jgi:hypothetical protein
MEAFLDIVSDFPDNEMSTVLCMKQETVTVYITQFKSRLCGKVKKSSRNLGNSPQNNSYVPNKFCARFCTLFYFSDFIPSSL